MNTWIAGKDLMKHHYQIKKAFYSELYLEDIIDKDNTHAQKVFEEFKNLKNLKNLPRFVCSKQYIITCRCI